jgi:hypothetical protein
MIDSIDAAVVTLVSHGEVDNLIHNGAQAEWIFDPDAKAIFLAAVEMQHGPKPIRPNRVNLLANTWGQLKDQKTIKHLVGLNGNGEASAPIIADKLLNRYLGNNAQQFIAKFNNLLTQKPNEAKTLLPQFLVEMENLTKSGQAYDPRPSAHKGSIVPPILFRSKLPTYNTIFEGNAKDGGGYRQGWWALWMGATGRGKTTHGYTMSVDGIRQDKKIVFISKERQEQVRARILLGLTGLTLDEIGKEQAIGQAEMRDSNGEVVMAYDKTGNVVGPWHEERTRQIFLEAYSEKVERLLRLYDWGFSTPRQIRAIISAEKPDMVNGDFYDVTDVVGNDKVVGLGIISRENEKIAHETGIHFNGFFQIAGQEKKDYEKNDSHVIGGPFGSTMATQFADTVLQTKWAKLQANHQHTRRNKCRLGGLEDSWVLPYDPVRWIFFDK